MGTAQLEFTESEILADLDVAEPCLRAVSGATGASPRTVATFRHGPVPFAGDRGVG